MNSAAILEMRLANQQLMTNYFAKPEELVQWMGCVQSQDLAGGKWAIGNRVKGATEAAISKCFGEGKILRTHVLRPTWHFVAPEDIRWLLQLTAPKIKVMSKGMLTKNGIDDSILKKNKKVIAHALADGKQLTREEIAAALNNEKINTDELRITLLLMDAELDGLICSGAMKGKQVTYALLEERVPPTKPIDRDAAIAELTNRYYTSHGSATIADLAWWSGLGLADVKKGVALNHDALAQETVDGQTYYFAHKMQAVKKVPHRVLLLPAFDEYNVAYKDRSHALLAEHGKVTGNGIFKPLVIVNGLVAGIWKRTERKANVSVDVQLFSAASKRIQKDISTAAEGYAHYLGKELKDIIFS